MFLRLVVVVVCLGNFFEVDVVVVLLVFGFRNENRVFCCFVFWVILVLEGEFCRFLLVDVLKIIGIKWLGWYYVFGCEFKFLFFDYRIFIGLFVIFKEIFDGYCFGWSFWCIKGWY